jgi:hypothetical protein
LLDPYGLQLDWKVIETAGKMRSIDMFLNFPVADMNRNVLWRNPEGVDAADLKRMNEFWGRRILAGNCLHDKAQSVRLSGKGRKRGRS